MTEKDYKTAQYDHLLKIYFFGFLQKQPIYFFGFLHF